MDEKDWDELRRVEGPAAGVLEQRAGRDEYEGSFTVPGRLPYAFIRVRQVLISLCDFCVHIIELCFQIDYA